MLFLPNVEGSIWKAIDGAYSLQGCPAGYEMVMQECVICPAASYCLGGSAPHVPCSVGLYSSPGSKFSSSCRSAVFVFTSLTFSINIGQFLDSEQEDLKLKLAFISNITPSDVEEVSIAETGLGQTLVVYKFATEDAISASNLRIKLVKVLSNPSSIKIVKIEEGNLKSVTVSDCPAGFTLQVMSAITNTGNDGVCEVCPAGYYCSGGSSAPSPCPTSSYSVPGSNASSSCTFAVFILVATTLQLPPSNFTIPVQRKFIAALASASGSAPEQVSVLSFSGVVARRLHDQETRIQIQIAAGDASSAGGITNHLDATNLNSQLSAQGLPPASLDSISILADSAKSSSTQQLITVLAIVGGLVVLLLVVLVYIQFLRSKVMVIEDSALTLKIRSIRQRLMLMPQDGFFLSTESRPYWNRNKQLFTLRQSQLEAAGRVALFRNFDVIHLDAFCLSLYLEQDSASQMRYKELCQWLLELAEQLINPEILVPQDFDPGHLGCTTVKERFEYFVKKLGKARIWIDDEVLFSSLKDKAQLLMDQIASKCNLRYQALCSEHRGKDLVSLEDIMQQDSVRWRPGKGNSMLKIFSVGAFPSSITVTASNKACSASFDTPISKSDLKEDEFANDKFGRSISQVSVARQDHVEVRSNGKSRVNLPVIACPLSLIITAEQFHVSLPHTRDSLSLILLTIVQVRAVFVTEDAAKEARAERCQNNSEAISGVSQLGLGVPCQLGEEVFLAQLHRRALLLNDGFQSRILNILSRYEVTARVESQGSLLNSTFGRDQERSAIQNSAQLKLGADMGFSLKLKRNHSSTDFSATESFLRRASTCSEQSLHSTDKSVIQLQCLFADGISSLEVQQAPIKTWAYHKHSPLNHLLDSLFDVCQSCRT